MHQLTVALTVTGLLRDTEIRDLDTTLVIDENICAFDVAMDDILVVQVLEAL
jgi:hypothetical protein